MNSLGDNRVRLRPVESQDVDCLLRWENEPKNWEVSGTNTPYSRALMQDYVQHARQSIYQAGQLRLMIQVDHHTIGAVDLFDFDPFHQRAGIGIIIGEEAWRQNGYARESLELLCDYCFQSLGLRQLYCNILIDNEQSLRLFRGIGFEITGQKRAWIRSGREFKDEYFLQLFNPGL